MKKQKKVLIVEDEAITGILLKEELNQNGYDTCQVATKGKEALEIFEADKPDVVLMDIRLGNGMDGIDVSKEIRRTSQVPIIFYTGYEDKETVSRAEEVKPAAFLIKPVQPETVIRIINGLF